MLLGATLDGHIRVAQERRRGPQRRRNPMTEAIAGRADRDWQWECLSCRAGLVAAGNALTCAGGGQCSPAAEQLPILVAEPAAYVRGELALLTRAIAGARQRLGSLEEIARAVGPPRQWRPRPRDGGEAEARR